MTHIANEPLAEQRTHNRSASPPLLAFINVLRSHRGISQVLDLHLELVEQDVNSLIGRDKQGFLDFLNHVNSLNDP